MLDKQGKDLLLIPVTINSSKYHGGEFTMAHDFSPDVPLFAQEAVISFELIMATMHKGQKEEMNRMNKPTINAKVEP